MIDLHSHVLPGVDDGAPDEPTALTMCRQAAADGIRTVVATPHFDPVVGIADGGAIAEAVERLRRRTSEEGIGVDLRFGAEMPLNENLVELYRSGAWPSYDPGRCYVLLEMLPIRNGLEILKKMVFQLRLAGATPILAHPERLDLFAEPEAVEEIRGQGARFQITASCLGDIRRPAGKRAMDWVRRGWVDVVATDAHDTAWRPPRLSPARQWLHDHAGEDVAEALTRGNPEKILAGRPL